MIFNSAHFRDWVLDNYFIIFETTLHGFLIMYNLRMQDQKATRNAAQILLRNNKYLVNIESH